MQDSFSVLETYIASKLAPTRVRVTRLQERRDLGRSQLAGDEDNAECLIFRGAPIASKLLRRTVRRASLGHQHAALDLIAFDGFEQGFEIALAESVVALALDELEEYRPQQRFGKDLQQ